MTGVYLDGNATAPVRPEAAQAVAAALGAFGNASSVHAAGRAARARIEDARAAVAALAGAEPSAVVFTSGGAEANALALASAVAAGSRRLIVSAVEHPTVLEAARAAPTAHELLPVDADGVADLAWLAGRLARWDAGEGRPFVALMLANNETGVIQPVAEAAALVRAAGGWLHVDAIQAAGKIPVAFASLGAHSLSLSAHKLGGPQGCGALVAAADTILARQLHGGGQERGYRAGTENGPGIAGFGAAAHAALRDLTSAAAQAAWRDAAQARLAAEGAVIAGAGAPRLPNTLCAAAPGRPSELQVIALDLAGVMVSAGSACSSGKVGASAVLTAMGFGDLAGCAIRASGSWATTQDDWARFTQAWIEANDRHAARRRASAA
jgi:cysteine desulfurase